MKGIILAGGTGSRLAPITMGVNKHLLPVFDKPMIYYPLSVLMLAGIREILIITSSNDIENYRRLLGDGTQIGLQIEFLIQDKPRGIADALIIGKQFIDNKNVALILGDNIFYGYGFSEILKKSTQITEGAKVFAYRVNEPSRFGVVELDVNQRPIKLVEKPKVPKSNLAVTGLYFFDKSAVSRAETLVPSERGELEITDVNQSYLVDGLLTVEILGRGFAWLDTGTTDALLDASHFVAAVERRQGLKVACLEEIAYTNRWIDTNVLNRAAELHKNTEYGKYLKNLSNEEQTNGS
jgi:glucose-1-phosphate thymidylyltransferase